MATQKSEHPRKKMRASLPPKLRSIFDQLTDEYQFHCINLYGKAFVNYHILADLVKDGWRPSHKPFVELEFGEKEKH